MKNHPDRQIAEYYDLDPISFTVLRSFALTQEEKLDGSYDLVLTIVLINGAQPSGSPSLKLAFKGVSGLRIDWPSLSVVTFLCIEVTDISDRGWEDLSYQVSEEEGSLAFSCRDFQASLV
jgi:hypothetical protein